VEKGTKLIEGFKTGIPNFSPFSGHDESNRTARLYNFEPNRLETTVYKTDLTEQNPQFRVVDEVNSNGISGNTTTFIFHY